jgi:transcription elongation factor GreA
MAQKEPMTVSGAEQLRQELQKLKNEDRRQISEAIAEARAHGDLKENAEYHAAKEKQGFIEGRIRELETKLSQANIIDVTRIPNQGKVIFGSTVTLFNVASDEEVTYQLVGEDEADIKVNKISVKSPIARSIIGKEENDAVFVKTPSGDVEYEVLAVEYK